MYDEGSYNYAVRNCVQFLLVRTDGRVERFSTRRGISNIEKDWAKFMDGGREIMTPAQYKRRYGNEGR